MQPHVLHYYANNVDYENGSAKYKLLFEQGWPHSVVAAIIRNIWK